MTRDEVTRLAGEAGMDAMVGTVRDGKYEPKVNAIKSSVPVEWLERFSALVIADFLRRTGQYVTNDTTRAAVVADAVAAEREKSCAELWKQIDAVRYHCSDATKQDVAVRALRDAIDAIRARNGAQ